MCLSPIGLRLSPLLPDTFLRALGIAEAAVTELDFSYNSLGALTAPCRAVRHRREGFRGGLHFFQKQPRTLFVSTCFRLKITANSQEWNTMFPLSSLPEDFHTSFFLLNFHLSL